MQNWFFWSDSKIARESSQTFDEAHAIIQLFSFPSSQKGGNMSKDRGIEILQRRGKEELPSDKPIYQTGSGTGFLAVYPQHG